MLQFRLLGPVTAVGPEGDLRYGGDRASCVLAALLLQPGRAVPMSRLIDASWGSSPPASAHVQVQNRVSALRRALRASDPHSDRIRTYGDGYAITVHSGELDLQRFRDGCAQARRAAVSAPDTAIALLDEALSRWRGPALLGLDTPVLRCAAEVFEEERIGAVEERARLQLQHSPGLAVPALTQLTTTHPFRETAHELLISALYRAGRQTDALDAYRAVRAALVRELGIEPGPDLQRLHTAILRGAGFDHAVAAGGRSDATVTDAAAPLTSDVPAQLPPDTAVFTGRTEPLRDLDAMLDSQARFGTTIAAVTGTAGVGKTTLAVHWAHRVAERFPDGQLYVNLHGFGPGGSVVDPADALAGFLEALAVPAQRIPAELQPRAALYRSTLAGRRVLIVVDNARDAAHVRPLLPGMPGCLTLITSRDQLGGLIAAEGATPVPLDLLAADEAMDLFGRRLDAARIDADPVAAAALAAHCVGLPLALALVAAQAAIRTSLPLAALATELAGTDAPLDVIDGADIGTDVCSVFSWSYQALSSNAAAVFRALGVHAGPDLDAHAAAAMVDLPLAMARRALAELVRLHLVREHAPYRYATHDLLRAYAATLTAGAERATASQRLFDHYLATTAVAMDLLAPATRPDRPSIEQLAERAVALSGLDAARAWLDAERLNLLATATVAPQYGAAGYTVTLAATIWEYLYGGGHPGDAVSICGHAVRLAHDAGDVVAEAKALRDLAVSLCVQHRFDQAIAYGRRALARYERLGDSHRQARMLGNLGAFFIESGRCPEAIPYYRRAMALQDAAGDRAGLAISRANLGLACYFVGQYAESRRMVAAARDVFTESGHHFGEVNALCTLGLLHEAHDEPAQALAQFAAAMAIATDLGFRNDQRGSLLVYLARTLRALDRLGEAQAHVTSGLALAVELGDQRVQSSGLTELGAITRVRGDLAGAVNHLERALTVSREASHLWEEITALTELAETLFQLGRPAEAADHFTEALRLAEAGQYRLKLAVAHHGLARVSAAMQDDVAALHRRTAHAAYADLGVAYAPPT